MYCVALDVLGIYVDMKRHRAAAIFFKLLLERKTLKKKREKFHHTALF